ncbi:Gfo/Idh/MocA family oxidoreductase [uncultured Psychrobacter sp.]|uniref:Gfo/Idh/MocA family oxidoreductase n=1 Tax=uncultured Psychrobacter sp. TaxID=259303 RepID=UPI003457598B
MKKVITYGSYDLLHEGHIRLLKRAKALGDYLVVGVTSESYDRSRGKLDVVHTTTERAEAIRKLEYVDEVIIEYDKGQKAIDIRELDIDIFAIGDDWVGSFDYLSEYCKVIYLPRTPAISSSMLREGVVKEFKIGVIGTGRIARRFCNEAKYVPHLIIQAAMSRNINNVREFIETAGIPNGHLILQDLLNDDIDAVYIASPHEFHFEQAKQALLSGKHVLCEKPVTLDSDRLEELLSIAKENELVFIEAIKTAFASAFHKLLFEVKNGKIGEVREVRSSFTKLIENKSDREWQEPYGGATNELASYPLLLAQKILGRPSKVHYFDQIDKETGVDLSNRIIGEYDSGAISISTVGIGAKTEGSAVISGSKGYIYIPAPWWLTKRFVVRYEDPNHIEEFEYAFEGDGLRYEISEFVTLVTRKMKASEQLTHEDMLDINYIINDYNEYRKN